MSRALVCEPCGALPPRLAARRPERETCLGASEMRRTEVNREGLKSRVRKGYVASSRRFPSCGAHVRAGFKPAPPGSLKSRRT